MQKDPYLILGLSRGASEDEVTAKYHELRDKYSEERFLEGEAGSDAARKLSALDEAYKDCIEDIRLGGVMNDTGRAYSEIETAIKAGHYDDAQRQLDDIDIRDAEWHYYQSMIYFKKGWHSESKTQLELCLALEPHNDKYLKALEKMNNFLGNGAPFKGENNNNNNQQQQQQQQQYQQPYQNPQQRAGYSDRQTNADANANACCDTCCTMMCCDSMCECMGGDLIPCC